MCCAIFSLVQGQMTQKVIGNSKIPSNEGAAQKLFCLVRERDTGRAASDLLLVTHDSMQSVNCKALTFNGL